MNYKTIQISWYPSNRQAKFILNKVRLEAGKLWSDLVEYHYEIRKKNEPWPTMFELFKHVKRADYPNLHSLSLQEVAKDFHRAIKTIRTLRKNGQLEHNYPTKSQKYHQVVYQAQVFKIKSGWIILPNGKAGKLFVKLPKNIHLEGKIVEVRLHLGKVELICKTDDVKAEPVQTIGVDLGVNTLISATDGSKALLISGREVKAIIQYRNKTLAEIQETQSNLKKYGRRWKRLQRVKYKMLTRCENKVKDVLHKATRKVADEFPNAKVYVGQPFNDAAQKLGRKQAQLVSQACNSKLIFQLNYKLNSATEVNEAYSSQTCPVCDARNKHGRIYSCACGVKAPRDVIGALNIKSIGENEMMTSGRSIPKKIRFIHPIKYPVRKNSQVVPVVTRQVA